MEKYNNSYIEKIYNIEKKCPISIISEVDSRDPKEVIDDTRMDGFRFFDIDGKKAQDGAELSNPQNRINQTKWILYGKRYSMEEARNNFPTQKELIDKFDEETAAEDVLLTSKNKIIPMNNNMMTYYEYLGKEQKIIKDINNLSKMIDKIGKRVAIVIIMDLIINMPEKEKNAIRSGYMLIHDILNYDIDLEDAKKVIFLVKLTERNIPLDFIINEIDNIESIYEKLETEDIILRATEIGTTAKMKLLKSYYFREAKEKEHKTVKVKERS